MRGCATSVSVISGDWHIMNQRMRLLIAYDGSSCGDAALDDLRRAGLPDDAQALVLAVADILPTLNTRAPAQPHPEWIAAAVEKAHARAAQEVEEARAMAARAAERVQSDHPGWEVRAEGCGDSPAWAIIAKAGEWQADLVAVGSHGHSGIKRLVLGSVSQKVLNNTSCSVRVARGRKSRKDSPVRLVLGADGSPDSDMALRALAARTWPAGSAVRVITAIDTLMSLSLAFALRPPAEAGLPKTDETDERALIGRMNQVAVEKLLPTGLAVSSLVEEGNPKHLLVEEAKRWKADCIFVGAKGLRGLERFLLGSVSTAVTARAHCSVEVVRAGQADGPGR